MPEGKKEEISQNEYKRGISGWNFDLEDLRTRASLISDNSEIFSIKIQEVARVLLCLRLILYKKEYMKDCPMPQVVPQGMMILKTTINHHAYHHLIKVYVIRELDLMDLTMSPRLPDQVTKMFCTMACSFKLMIKRIIVVEVVNRRLMRRLQILCSLGLLMTEGFLYVLLHLKSFHR
ncbi:serine/threonine-protein kinase BLUS1 [Iris pallida]|uniref:Serine/threonine-protein kinase BLUS1 n=1 Tax=Iris pallida TaxID=29817 RepID=A0AAX6GHD7_IRIPA|nr:serine/threonine-protein kinase BLUS1 [Iris pallida]